MLAVIERTNQNKIDIYDNVLLVEIKEKFESKVFENTLLTDDSDFEIFQLNKTYNKQLDTIFRFFKTFVWCNMISVYF